MKKVRIKVKAKKPTEKIEKEKKIEVEEYIDSITDTDDNTNPDYPFDEGKPITSPESNENNV